MIDIKLREDIFYLKGCIEAANSSVSTCQNDLIASISKQYDSILKRVCYE